MTILARGTDVARHAVRIVQALRNGYVPVLVPFPEAVTHIVAILEAFIHADGGRI